jgi:lysophospholipase L1-like esterase
VKPFHLLGETEPVVRRRTSLVVVLAAAAAAGVLTQAQAAPTYREYVALGDSWSADVFTSMPPTTTHAPIDCAQSDTNYPHQVAAVLGVKTFRDATCGSATTEHFTHPQSLPLGGVNPPQFNRLSRTTDLVTIGIGGNDIGLAGDIEGCLSAVPTPVPGAPAYLGGTCKATFTAGGVDSIEKSIRATAPKIALVIKQVRQRSPKARILLVNYLNGIPVTGKGCWPVVPIQDVDVAYLQEKFVQMNAMLAAVARSSRVQLVDTYTPTIGHDVCQVPTVRYVEGLVPASVSNPLLAAFPFHPNAQGANAQTRAVLAALGR